MRRFFIVSALVLAASFLPTIVHADPEGPVTFRYVDNRGDPPAVWIISWTEDGQQVFTTDGIAQRRTGAKVRFDEAEIVLGAFIRLDDGREASNCYTAATPMSGTVFGGVINPWDTERRSEHPDCAFTLPAGAPPAAVATPTPGPVPTVVVPPTVQPEPPRRASSVGQTIRFLAGERVWGFAMRLDDGRSFSQCVLENAPMNGFVLDGVVWPWLSEIAGKPSCK